MICKLCRKNKSLIKCHIYPRSLFKSGEGEKPFEVMSSNIDEDCKNFISKRIQSGFYDNDIVCLECEKTFGIWDQYGIEFLTKKTFSKKTILICIKSRRVMQPFPYLNGCLSPPLNSRHASFRGNFLDTL